MLEPTLAEGLEHQRRELFVMDDAGDRAAAETERLGDRIVVNATRGGLVLIARLAHRPCDYAVVELDVR